MGDRIYAYLIEVIVEPDDGQYYAHCPGLQGVHESGKTPEEAIANAYDAVISILEAHRTQGDLLPEGPHLIALRQPPTLSMNEILAKANRIDRRAKERRREELLVPVPS
jgi:predicted RNase H-like HicB family nuclease